MLMNSKFLHHDDVIKWKHFPRYWPFVRGIHRSPLKSPHKGQWRGALMFTLICTWINALVHNREAGDLRRHRPHYDVIVMTLLQNHRPTFSPSLGFDAQEHHTVRKFPCLYHWYLLDANSAKDTLWTKHDWEVWAVSTGIYLTQRIFR